MKYSKTITLSLALLFLFQAIACDEGSEQASAGNSIADNSKSASLDVPNEHLAPIDVSEEEKPKINEALSASEVYASFSDSVVVVENFDHFGELVSRGTGFFISQDGLLVTNMHVIEGASKLLVRLNESEAVQVLELIASSKSSDIAILRVSGDDYPWIPIKSNKLSVGDDVYVIGNPLGFLEKTLSTGVVSAFREFSGEEHGAGIEMIQITAATSSGSSGSPLINSFGQVAGVIVGGYEGGENLNMASSSSNVMSLLNSNSKPQAIENFYRLQDIRGLKLVNVPADYKSKIHIEIHQFSSGDAPDLAAMVKQQIMSELSKGRRFSAGSFVVDKNAADIIIRISVAQHKEDNVYGIYCLAKLEAVQNLQLERAFDVLIEDPKLREIAKINCQQFIDGFLLSNIQKECKSPDELLATITEFLVPVRFHEGTRLRQHEQNKK